MTIAQLTREEIRAGVAGQGGARRIPVLLHQGTSPGAFGPRATEVQAIGVTVEELKPLLDAVGPKGMYIMMWPKSMAEAEQALAIAASYR